MEIRLEKECEKVRYAPQPMSQVETVTHAPHPSDNLLQGDQGERRGAIRREETKSAPGTFVTSPMVGTFYSSNAPDQPAFVKVGDKVNEQTVVCIIEAMKVMNEVKAGVSGVVAEILADNSQPVEFGTRLLRIQQ